MTTTSGSPWVVFVIAVVFVLVLGYFLWSRKRQRDSAWEGVVVDKRSQATDVSNPERYNQPGSITIGGGPVAQTTYRLEIKTDDGTNVSIDVGQGIFEQAQVGDRYAKRAGEMEPQRVAEAKEAPPNQG